MPRDDNKFPIYEKSVVFLESFNRIKLTDDPDEEYDFIESIQNFSYPAVRGYELKLLQMPQKPELPSMAHLYDDKVPILIQYKEDGQNKLAVYGLGQNKEPILRELAEPNALTLCQDLPFTEQVTVVQNHVNELYTMIESQQLHYIDPTIAQRLQNIDTNKIEDLFQLLLENNEQIDSDIASRFMQLMIASLPVNRSANITEYMLKYHVPIKGTSIEIMQLLHNLLKSNDGLDFVANVYFAQTPADDEIKNKLLYLVKPGTIWDIVHTDKEWRDNLFLLNNLPSAELSKYESRLRNKIQRAICDKLADNEIDSNELKEYFKNFNDNEMTKDVIDSLISLLNDDENRDIIKELIVDTIFSSKNEVLKAQFSAAFITAVKEKKIQINDVYSLVLAHYYKDSLQKLSYLIFPENTPYTREETKTNSLNRKDQFQVIYNNEGYVAGRSNAKPLVLSDTDPVPIGYNIHLPPKEVQIKNVVVSVYGGSLKSSREERAYIPNDLDEHEIGLIKDGTIYITLNLPDLLKLDVYQMDMPEALHQEIQACIHKFYETLSQTPELLSEKLKEINFNDLNINLYGASFGGGLSMRHAQLYPGTFNGYISHDGALSHEMAKKSDLLEREISSPWLNPAVLSQIQHVSEPLLLLHNKDDNNVSVKETLHYYELLKAANKEHLVKIHVSEIGNPLTHTSDVNKGHFQPQDKDNLKRYIATLFHFIENGASSVPEASMWQAYLQDKLANTHYKSASVRERVIARMLEKERMPSQEQLDKAWRKDYKATYYAHYYADNITQDDDKFKMELERLINHNFLTDEVLAKVILLQAIPFSQYMWEKHQIDIPNEVLKENVNFLVAALREVLSDLSTKPDERTKEFKRYILTLLYQAEPSLLKPFYGQFKSDTQIKNDFKETKSELKKTYAKQRKLVTNTWKGTIKGVEHIKQKNINKILTKIESIKNQLPGSLPVVLSEIIKLSEQFANSPDKFKIILKLNDIVQHLEQNIVSQEHMQNVILAKLAQAIIINSASQTLRVTQEAIESHCHYMQKTNTKWESSQSKQFIDEQFQSLVHPHPKKESSHRLN